MGHVSLPALVPRYGKGKRRVVTIDRRERKDFSELVRLPERETGSCDLILVVLERFFLTYADFGKKYPEL